MSAQPNSVILWVMFGPTQTSADHELILALSPENGPTYSDKIVLRFEQSETNRSFRISLDQLLDHVYTAYNSWPTGTATLRLYLAEMSIYSLNLVF